MAAKLVESSITQSFFNIMLQFIDIAGSRVSVILFFKKFRTFHLDLGQVNYQAIYNMNIMAVRKFCHNFRVVSWGTIRYEMIMLMSPPE